MGFDDWGESIFDAILGWILHEEKESDQNKRTDEETQQRVKEKTEEYDRQKEFAQQGIRWRTEDAKLAGLHPLSALGAGSTSYSPQAIGGQNTGRSGSKYSSMGQVLKTLVGSKSRKKDEKLNLRYKELQNQYLEGQINNMNTNRTPTDPQGKVIDGQPVTSPGAQPGTTIIPSEISTSSQHGVQAGIPPVNQYRKDKRGIVYSTISSNSEQAFSDEAPILIRLGLFGNMVADKYRDFQLLARPKLNKKHLSWLRRERSNITKAYPLPYGQEYRYNALTSAWEPHGKKHGHSQIFRHSGTENIK